jgi:hypothetical protein
MKFLKWRKEMDNENTIITNRSYSKKELDDIMSCFHYVIEDGVVAITGVKQSQKVLRIPDVVGIIKEKSLGENCNDLPIRIEKIINPSSVYKIEKLAFHINKYVKEIEFEGELTKLEFGTFMGCLSLEKINIPYCMKNIAKGVFKLTKLSKVFVPRNCIIEEGAFESKVVVLKGFITNEDVLLKEKEILSKKGVNKDLEISKIKNKYNKEKEDLMKKHEQNLLVIDKELSLKYQHKIDELKSETKRMQNQLDELK